MTTQELHSLIRAQPFILHMADGRQVEVNYPEWIAYAGGRIALVIKPEGGFENLDLLLIPSLEVKTGSPTKS